MTETDTLHGGCLCGAVRYALRGPAAHTTVCHCSDCQRASAAPFVAWTFFPAGSITWTRGSPKKVAFANRIRSFCGDCGTPLHFFDPEIPQWFEVTTCSLDDPVAHTPAEVCWVRDRLPWCGGLALLPEFPENAPLPGGS